MLNTVILDGPTDRPTLLIAHGLMGSARNWATVGKALAEHRRVITVDMRNHGDSPWADSHSYPDLASDLAEVIEAHGGPMDVLGHSMGGKAAMTLALMRPDLVRRLISADIAPVASDRSHVEMIDAMQAVDFAGVTRRSDVAKQMTGVDPAIVPYLLQSLDLEAKRWKLNLAVLKAEMPHILGFPPLERQFEGPTLLLAGGASDFILPEFRAPTKALFPAARFAKIPNAGHWLHSDRPNETRLAIETYLSADFG